MLRTDRGRTYDRSRPNRSKRQKKCLPGRAVHICLSRQRALSSFQARAGMARPARVPHQAAFHPALLPAPEPDRAAMGLMHRNVTHNKCYATCGQFADATLDFLRDKVPKNWRSFRDSVTDNFRVINPKDFRVLT